MDVTEFHMRADEKLEELAETLEEADTEGVLEVDLHDGILSIALEDGREYVINKHQATQKIWFSSPESGAAYFVYNEEDETWEDEENELDSLLFEELSEVIEL